MGYLSRAHARVAGFNVKATMTRPELWAIDVWYNMGWHCALKCNNVRLGVYPISQTAYRFNCLVSSDKDICGPGLAAWSNTDHEYPTAQETVDAAVSAAVAYTKKLTEACEYALEATNARAN